MANEQKPPARFRIGVGVCYSWSYPSITHARRSADAGLYPMPQAQRPEWRSLPGMSPVECVR